MESLIIPKNRLSESEIAFLQLPHKNIEKVTVSEKTVKIDIGTSMTDHPVIITDFIAKSEKTAKYGTLYVCDADMNVECYYPLNDVKTFVSTMGKLPTDECEQTLNFVVSDTFAQSVIDEIMDAIYGDNAESCFLSDSCIGYDDSRGFIVFNENSGEIKIFDKNATFF